MSEQKLCEHGEFADMNYCKHCEIKFLKSLLSEARDFVELIENMAEKIDVPSREIALKEMRDLKNRLNAAIKGGKRA